MTAQHPGPSLHPVLVVLGGRSGSTLLMQLLGSSPRVAFDRVPPFENRYLTYLVRWSQQLHAAPPSDDWRQLDLLDPDAPPRLIGPIPIDRAELLGDADHPLWPAALGAVWGAFSDHARCAPSGNAGASHYAEKAPPFVRDALDRTGIEHTALYPVRDPRDVYLSIMGMGRKRGGAFWGYRPDDTPQSFARRFSKSWRGRYELVIGIEERPDQTVVRYEDMVGDLPAQAQRLGALIGVELDADAVLAQRAEFASHMTSDSAAASIQRWRRGLDPGVQEIFAESLGDVLDALGYER